MGLHKQAERLLAEIAAVDRQIGRIEAEAQEELAAVKKKYQESFSVFGATKKTLESQLVKLMKHNRAALFAETDQVDLATGILLHGKEDKVGIPRDALEKLETLKWEDGIKRSAAINREAIEKWPDERLVQIGAERKVKEVFSYELKERRAESKEHGAKSAEE